MCVAVQTDSFENGGPLVLLSVDQRTDSASTWPSKKMMD
jgi:hypothetical protein